MKSTVDPLFRYICDNVCFRWRLYPELRCECTHLRYGTRTAAPSWGDSSLPDHDLHHLAGTTST